MTEEEEKGSTPASVPSSVLSAQPQPLAVANLVGLAMKDEEHGGGPPTEEEEDKLEDRAASSGEF